MKYRKVRQQTNERSLFIRFMVHENEDANPVLPYNWFWMRGRVSSVFQMDLIILSARYKSWPL